VRITGLEEFQRKLRELKDRVESLSGEHSVPIFELLSPSFLAGCTLFNSAEELFTKSGFKVESQADFDAIPNEAWDEFIHENTSFSSWKEMLDAAGAAWVNERLNLN
jgi:hypothetical protein